MANIIISGLTAAGKTTHSTILAERFGLRYVGASDVALEAFGMQMAELPPDYWLTADGMRILHAMGDKIDRKLLELEADGTPTVFDAFYFPWLHARPALVVWLESDVPSRVKKVIVSHKGIGRYHGDDLIQRIESKDIDAAKMLAQLSGADLLSNREPFDYTVNLSRLIDDPTPQASQRSIRAGDELLNPLVEAYLGRCAASSTSR